MNSFSSLPAGYIPCVPTIYHGRLAGGASEIAVAESRHLLKNFSKVDEKIGLCVPTLTEDRLLEYLALCNQFQQRNKKVKFYPCFVDPQALLLFLNAFSFFISAKHVMKRVFSINPNQFYSHLSERERVMSDLQTLKSMEKIITHPDHPYTGLTDPAKTITTTGDLPFIFDVSNEKSL